MNGAKRRCFLIAGTKTILKKDARGAAIQRILESLNKEGKSLISAKQIVYFLEISLQYSLHLLNMMDNLIKHNVLSACCSFAQKNANKPEPLLQG